MYQLLVANFIIMGAVATYHLKSEKLTTPAEMIQPRYDPEYKFLIPQHQQRQPMCEIRPRVAKAKQASRRTILVQPRYKWRLFRYKLAADQCEDVSDEAAFLGWSYNVKLELKRHNSIVEQKLGLNPTIETALHPATAKYKDFLLATASGNVQDSAPVQQSKIPAYTLGAMTPSLRLYAFLSKEMQTLVSAYVDSHPYSKWFEEYSYKRFKASYRDAEELLDKLCNSLSQEEIQVSEQTLILPIYPNLDAKKEPNIEILSAQKPDQQRQGEDRDGHSQIASIDLGKTWELLSQQYALENENFKKEIMLAVSFDYGRLYRAFEKLSSPDGQAVPRIFGSGVNNPDVSVTVMSCWSGDLTRSALSGDSDMLNVDGNEFTYADGIFTGDVTRQAHQSAIAKVEYFDDMVWKYGQEHIRIPRSVFIGSKIPWSHRISLSNISISSTCTE
ncbi:hypothetical protein C5167_006208 [Papaver somniferum]|uniref:Thiaminase-2/PQQC domain-containing protein n=1 Tax=Papaver somniferum TaxID=3469 RepID=A0A4Y7JCN7_PAPSO|nr:hypothetical protein C5167_006208 [Papaver somniferum]